MSILPTPLSSATPFSSGAMKNLRKEEEKPAASCNGNAYNILEKAFMYIYVCMYVYIYIYIYREREIYIYIYMYSFMY